MFRDMRRKGQALSTKEVIEILVSGPTGVLGLIGDDGYPYTVPLNYLYRDGRLFFHCGQEGHKLDGIRGNDKVSFCVVARDRVVPSMFATDYRSVIAFGRARIVTDEEARQAALEGLIDKYSTGFEEEGKREIERDRGRVCVVEMRIEHVTGKAALRSVREADLRT